MLFPQHVPLLLMANSVEVNGGELMRKGGEIYTHEKLHEKKASYQKLLLNKRMMISPEDKVR